MQNALKKCFKNQDNTICMPSSKKCKLYGHEVAILKHKIIKIRFQMDDEKV
jgi:hypothetical protein